MPVETMKHINKEHHSISLKRRPGKWGRYLAIYSVIISLIIFGCLKCIYTKEQTGELRDKLEDVFNRLGNDEVDTKQDDDSTFELRHIFHRGTGRHNYKVHRRLDVTQEYLEAHREALKEPMIRQEVNIDESNLQEVYDAYDWPKVHENKNPWSIKLPIKKAHSKGRVKRLKERHTPNFLDSYLAYALSVKGNPALLNKIDLEWEEEREIPIPDVNDKDTVVSLATISSNAYVKFPKDDDEKKRLDWVDVGEPWVPDENHTDIDFGWAEDGLRGHVFVSKDNKTVVLGIKGTSGAGLIGTGPEETANNDKLNDNLLFLCCCARVGYMWTTVCDCYEKAYTCNQDCLEKELMRQDRYYQATLDLYRNVSKIYDPLKTDIWVTGHSLGGALASLLGRTYGLPAVAFEAPGEMLATRRLHLPQPPGIPKHLENIWHFGNTGDPIYMGVCNGVSSSCNVAGYAMETACHTAQQCVYDVVTDMGWRVNLLNHRIHTVIDDIILVYNSTPACVQQPPCRDCFNWRFTSSDDTKNDEPSLPNPLHSKHPISTVHSSSKSDSLSASCSLGTAHHASSCTLPNIPSSSSFSSHPSQSPAHCLRRTWYGRCTKWGHNNA